MAVSWSHRYVPRINLQEKIRKSFSFNQPLSTRPCQIFHNVQHLWYSRRFKISQRPWKDKPTSHCSVHQKGSQETFYLTGKYLNSELKSMKIRFLLFWLGKKIGWRISKQWNEQASWWHSKSITAKRMYKQKNPLDCLIFVACLFDLCFCYCLFFDWM